MKFNKLKMVSASDIGMAAKCGHYLVLQYQGVKPSTKAIEARIRGDMAHENLNRTVAEDNRCYIASHLYGADHQATQILRQYRDKNLSKTRLGKLFISFYYAVSPDIVKACRQFMVLDYLMSTLVSWILIKAIERQDRD